MLVTLVAYAIMISLREYYTSLGPIANLSIHGLAAPTDSDICSSLSLTDGNFAVKSHYLSPFVHESK